MIATLLAGLVPCVTAAPCQEAERTRPWIGAWKAVEKEEILRLEPARASWLRGDTPVFYRLTPTESGARFESWARWTDFELAVEGDELRMTSVRESRGG